MELWRIVHTYDNGENYVGKRDIEFVQGTAEDVHKYLANKVGYDSKNLIDFYVTKNDADGCFCPTIIANNFGWDRLQYVKASHRKGRFGTDCYSFCREATNICYAQIVGYNGYKGWDTDTYVASPISFDEIVKTL